MSDDPFSEESSEGVAPWIVTFADMMSLLLTFFVMLLSLSEIDAEKYRAISGSMKNAFGVQKVEMLLNKPSGESPITSGDSTTSILDQLDAILSEALSGAKYRRDGRSILLTIPGSLMFESGKADIRPQMNSYLQKIAQMVKARPHLALQVEGHTDDIPIQTAQFQSNWELSTARATAVIRFLIEQCGASPTQLAAAGYADSHPIVPNDSAENREQNRRVEFRFVEKE